MLGKAAQVFAKFKSATKWTPKTCPNGTKITYVNKGGNVIEKLVERTNGTSIRSTFHDGKLLGVREENSRGVIEHYFGALNYNKMLKVDTNRGESFCRLANKGKSGFLDTNYNYGGRNFSAQGNFSNEIKSALDYVRANSAKSGYVSKYDDIIAKLKAEWASKPAVAQSNDSAFEKFIQRWAK